MFPLDRSPNRDGVSGQSISNSGFACVSDSGFACVSDMQSGYLLDSSMSSTSYVVDSNSVATRCSYLCYGVEEILERSSFFG